MTETLRLQMLQSGLLPAALLLAMLLMAEIGWRIGREVVSRRKTPAPETAISDSDNALIGSVFGLLALLIAFTFSGAYGRYELHRDLIVKEVSAIGSAWRSIGLLPDAVQPKVREEFRRYVDHRITFYEGKLDTPTLEALRVVQGERADRLWQATVVAVRQESQAGERNLDERAVADLAVMLDAFDAEFAATKAHPPRIIFISLLLLALIGAITSGYKMGLEKSRDWLITLVFAVLMSASVNLIVNLEYPRLSAIGLHEFDHDLVELRKTM